MKQDGIMYYAEEGNFIVRKEDNFIMGEDICLGETDNIENYKEEPYTEESYNAFYESIGMESPKAREKRFKEERNKRINRKNEKK